MGNWETNDAAGVEYSSYFLLAETQVFIFSDLILAGKDTHALCACVCVKDINRNYF